MHHEYVPARSGRVVWPAFPYYAVDAHDLVRTRSQLYFEPVVVDPSGQLFFRLAGIKKIAQLLFGWCEFIENKITVIRPGRNLFLTYLLWCLLQPEKSNPEIAVKHANIKLNLFNAFITLGFRQEVT